MTSIIHATISEWVHTMAQNITHLHVDITEKEHKITNTKQQHRCQS